VKGWTTFLAAVMLGGFGLWAAQKASGWRQEKEAVPSEALLTQADAAPSVGASLTPAESSPRLPAKQVSGKEGPPALVKRPIFYEGDPPSGLTPSTRDDAAPPDGNRQPPESPLARPAKGTAMEEERRAALAAFDSGAKDPGARERGVKLLEGIYASSKDRSGVDLSPEVERLLEGETKLGQRRDYLRYLVERDKSGRVFEEQLARGIKRTSFAENDSASAFQAWDELSLAYEIASNRAERRRVLASLEPFLHRMVFSGRYTPLLTSYTIKPGNSLTGVAAQFHTTSDALRRINGLKADVIQPRQRLRILPGKVKLFVDKSEFILWATIEDRVFLEYPVGLGRDNGTPMGTFVIHVRQKDPSWWRPGEAAIPAGDPKNILGTRWLGFKETPDYAGFGIHGTSDPTSLGKESSAGCVRLRNEDIELLYDFVPYGTEVVILQ